MALDGAFLRHLKKELETVLQGSRVDKIYQPSHDELFLSMRSQSGSHWLLLSARADSARIHLVDKTPENPKYPPMLCMLLRKRLLGAHFVQIRQPGLERVLLLDFDGTNELGDSTRLTLAVEIMGRYSNVIFMDENEKIIDALKRVDAEMSSARLVLPGLSYRLPPPQKKLDLLEVSAQEICAQIQRQPADMELQKALLKTLQGVSPVVCRELQFAAGHGSPVYTHEISQEESSRLLQLLEQLQQTIRETSGKPMLVQGSKKPLDFSFFPIHQYGSAARCLETSSFSALLHTFFGERDRLARIHAKSQDLSHILTTVTERLTRKINHQRAELQQCADRERLRIFGDLLNANLYRLQKGASSAQLENFYAPGQPTISIPLDPALTPSQNAQHYYKQYRKAKTAQQVLAVQIANATEELAYLDTVREELARAQRERDFQEIRAELAEQGYLRNKKGKRQKEQPVKPMRFSSSDGFTIWVGRNNRQNDQLTLKQAHKNDLWFHTQKIPGSHVILQTEGRTPTTLAIQEAAGLAAFYSRGKGSAQVPVDYTLVRHVSKPQGAKPGMVIYTNQKTLYVTPDAEFVKSRMQSGANEEGLGRKENKL